MPSPIDSAALGEMALEALVLRMDAVLRQSIVERYGAIPDGFPSARVSDILSTVKARALAEEDRKYLAYVTFSYLVQMELGMTASGISNIVLFGEGYSEVSSWSSPAFQLRCSAIQQYQIVSSRIAMELFMDLLHCLEAGERLEWKKSKLKAFRKWLCDPQNPFHYFAHTLLAAYRFDRGIRSPEVHGTSKMPKRVLLLQRRSHDQLNECHHLTNALLGCWQPLVDILDGKKPTYMHIQDEDKGWFEAYMSGSEDDVVNKLALMFSGIQ